MRVTLGVATPLLLAASALVVSAIVTSPPAHVAILGPLGVQDGGRIKPLSSLAHELVAQVDGARPFDGETVMGLDSVTWLFSMATDSDRWQGESIIRVHDKGLRTMLGLDTRRAHFSYLELTARLASTDADSQVEIEPNATLTSGDRERLAMRDTLARLEGIFSQADLRMVARGQGAEITWTSIRDLNPDGAMAPLRQSRDQLFRATSGGDADALSTAAATFAQELAAVTPVEIVTRRPLLRLETYFHRVRPFRIAWLLYSVALAVIGWRAVRGGEDRGLGRATAVAALLVHSGGIASRVLIAQRAPVTNMFESVIWVGWGAMVLALLLDRERRSRHFIVCGLTTALAALLIADAVPMPSRWIEPLVPVLRDNLWLTIHVLTISLAYSAFALASCLAHVELIASAFGKPRSQVTALSKLVYRCMQIGVLLGIGGALLGGWWASYAWGRFWGWDAKETSVFISLATYVAILHARSAGWLADWGMAAAAVLAFLGVLWSWYGVNFVLGIGLHTYGFGFGGYRVFFGVVICELLIVALLSAPFRAVRSLNPSASRDRHPASPQEAETAASRRLSVPTER